MKVLIINGPNINMLGVREPEVYGIVSYDSLVRKIYNYCEAKSIDCECYQSNHEGDIVDKIQLAYGKADGIIINPAAYTHTSVAILDALKAVSIPTVEVHISKIDQREDFRKISYVSLAAEKVIAGHGIEGYFEAVDYLIEKRKK